jgi:hypothetical protein
MCIEWRRGGGCCGGEHGGREECDGLVPVIAETGTRYGIGVGEVGGKVDAIDERAVGVGGVLTGQGEDRLEAPGTAGGDDEDAEAVRVVAVLENVIQPDLALPGIRERTAVDRKENLLVSGRKVASNRGICHSKEVEIP